jgi:cytochrome c5
VARGRETYGANCSICHGAEGQGKPRLGKDLRSNAFVGKMSDAELLDFLIEGRPAFHPDNQQGIEMPPRGGNPGLTDRDLEAIVAFLRTL